MSNSIQMVSDLNTRRIKFLFLSSGIKKSNTFAFSCTTKEEQTSKIYLSRAKIHT